MALVSRSTWSGSNGKVTDMLRMAYMMRVQWASMIATWPRRRGFSICCRMIWRVRGLRAERSSQRLFSRASVMVACSAPMHLLHAARTRQHVQKAAAFRLQSSPLRLGSQAAGCLRGKRRQPWPLHTPIWAPPAVCHWL